MHSHVLGADQAAGHVRSLGHESVRGFSALKRGVKRMVVRTVHWEVCGQRLFRGVPLIHHDKLKLLGADLAIIRVDWDEVNRLVFRHVEVGHCRSGRAKSPVAR